MRPAVQFCALARAAYVSPPTWGDVVADLFDCRFPGRMDEAVRVLSVGIGLSTLKLVGPPLRFWHGNLHLPAPQAATGDRAGPALLQLP